jgi:hypothetical protein
VSNQEHRDPQDPGDQAALKRAWQQASDELPPPELDARLIAAARKSVQVHGSSEKADRESTRPRNWMMQWQPLAAAATVAGLAFILLQVMPRDRDVTPSIRIEDSAPGPAMARPATAAPPAIDRVEADRAAAEPGEAAAAAVEQKAGGQLTRESVDDLPAGPANADADRQPAISPERGGANVVTTTPALAGTSVASTAPQSEKRQRDNATMSSADWVARIEALYASGDLAGATDALRAFRAAEPDADTYLPESMRDWARTVE